MTAATLDAPEILNRVYLEIRAKLLEVGASLDRLDRADGLVDDDPRLGRIRQALAILAAGQPDRAEQIQLLFSLPYEDDWLTKLNAERNGAAKGAS
ncbi:MAG: hypothetical protein AB7O62_10450 [Pirellulales bacterium]